MEKPHVEMTENELISEGVGLAKKLQLPYLNAERKAGIQQQLGYIVFELAMREVGDGTDSV